jgi:hypothetical protein
MIPRVDTSPPSATPYAPPPAPQHLGPPLVQRLRSKRIRLVSSLDTVANVGCFLSSGCVLGMCTGIGLMIFTAAGAAISSSGDMEGLAVLFGIVVGAAALVGVHWLLRYAVRGLFANYYREASRWLYHTDMLALFVDENQTAQIIELINDTPGLRWMSAPRPRKLEEALEFAACYFGAYRKLLYGPGRIDTGTVFLGSLAWFAGQRQCLLLGCCCSNQYTLAFCVPAWIVAGLGYVNRLAVETCCIDYLLGEPREPGQALSPFAYPPTHDVGPRPQQA